MSLISINTDPTSRQLRQFGLVSLVALPLVAWLWTRSSTVTLWSVVAGLIFAGLGLLAPKLLKPVFIGLTVVAAPFGLLIGELVLLMIYLGVFLPMALAMRVIGRDALQRSPESGTSTYWTPRVAVKDVRRYYRQY